MITLSLYAGFVIVANKENFAFHDEYTISISPNQNATYPDSGKNISNQVKQLEKDNNVVVYKQSSKNKWLPFTKQVFNPDVSGFYAVSGKKNIENLIQLTQSNGYVNTGINYANDFIFDVITTHIEQITLMLVFVLVLFIIYFFTSIFNLRERSIKLVNGISVRKEFLSRFTELLKALSIGFVGGLILTILQVKIISGSFQVSYLLPLIIWLIFVTMTTILIWFLAVILSHFGNKVIPLIKGYMPKWPIWFMFPILFLVSVVSVVAVLFVSGSLKVINTLEVSQKQWDQHKKVYVLMPRSSFKRNLDSDSSTKISYAITKDLEINGGFTINQGHNSKDSVPTQKNMVISFATYNYLDYINFHLQNNSEVKSPITFIYRSNLKTSKKIINAYFSYNFQKKNIDPQYTDATKTWKQAIKNANYVKSKKDFFAFNNQASGNNNINSLAQNLPFDILMVINPNQLPVLPLITSTWSDAGTQFALTFSALSQTYIKNNAESSVAFIENARNAFMTNLNQLKQVQIMNLISSFIILMTIIISVYLMFTIYQYANVKEQAINIINGKTILSTFKLLIVGVPLAIISGVLLGSVLTKISLIYSLIIIVVLIGFTILFQRNAIKKVSNNLSSEVKEI
ncbi:MAG: hypothetical protein LBC17_01505 [Lactobacillaceae bacterium]|jgi:hypothetical protein|nr:hypothetical protein [Lactobacillaceae bacterium]